MHAENARVGKKENEETHYCVKYGCREDCSDFSDTFLPPVFCVPVEEGICSTTGMITDRTLPFGSSVSRFITTVYTEVKSGSPLSKKNDKSYCQLPNLTGFQEQDPEEHYGVKQTEVLESVQPPPQIQPW